MHQLQNSAPATNTASSPDIWHIAGWLHARQPRCFAAAAAAAAICHGIFFTSTHFGITGMHKHCARCYSSASDDDPFEQISHSHPVLHPQEATITTGLAHLQPTNASHQS
jgi:hypothetical protein